MIIKAFRKKGLGFVGQNVESWAGNWNNIGDLSKALKNTEKDYLSPFFKRYFPFPPKKIIEGGCGTGKYVIAYRKLGYDILGVDFVPEMIKRIKKEVNEDLPVYEGNVTKLPFEDAFFDCYYSGGVMEHFEEGPDRMLKEAHRVLKKNGILLATVPFVNLIRRFYFSAFAIKEKDGFLLKRCKICQKNSDIPKDYEFCEYIFDSNSLEPYFKINQFIIDKIYPIDFLWGEMGLFFRKLITRIQDIKKDRKVLPVNGKDYSKNKIDNKSFFESLVYDFLVTENRDNILFKLPLTVLNYLSGHMVLFVVRAI